MFMVLPPGSWGKRSASAAPCHSLILRLRYCSFLADYIITNEAINALTRDERTPDADSALRANAGWRVYLRDDCFRHSGRNTGGLSGAGDRPNRFIFYENLWVRFMINPLLPPSSPEGKQSTFRRDLHAHPGAAVGGTTNDGSRRGGTGEYRHRLSPYRSGPASLQNITGGKTGQNGWHCAPIWMRCRLHELNDRLSCRNRSPPENYCACGHEFPYRQCCLPPPARAV